MKLPELYLEKMKRLLGAEFDDYIKSFDEPRYYGIRVNTLKITPDELLKKVDWQLERVPWCQNGFYYDGERVRPAKSPYYSAGLYYIQEPSAMSTGVILPVEKGDRILDLCAAPGGKSTQAAAKLCGRGMILSNDISPARCKALIRNIELAGLDNCIVTSESPEKLADKLGSFFNKIIVDAPCSGEGMFRKDENAAKSWESHKTEMCCTLQRGILDAAARLLCDGGIMAYSTCTFAPEEDEGMIGEFLAKHSEFEIIDFDKSGGFIDGRPEWAGAGEELKKSGRLMPYKVKGEGHFLCLLRKKGEGKPSNPMREKPIDEKLIKDYIEFENNFLNIHLREGLTIHGSSLMRIPEGLDLSGLRVMRSGAYLGELKKNRFEPSQAFAMMLKKEDCKITLDFALNDEGLQRYMRGESFNVGCRDGWALVCLEGYPLGWGKVQGGRLKNKYLPSWMN